MNMLEFKREYPNYEFLEGAGRYTRLSNGEGEGSEHESLWFCDDCENEVLDPCEGCPDCHEGG